MGNCTAKADTVVVSSKTSPNSLSTSNLQSSERKSFGATRASFVDTADTAGTTTGTSPPSKQHGLALLVEDEIWDLRQCLEAAGSLLGTRKNEGELTKAEIKSALLVYHELKRVLSMTTRTDDYFAVKDALKPTESDYHATFNDLMAEFDEADDQMKKVLSKPAAVRPLGHDALQEVNEFFILDNSLRETTVGAARGHTLEEKHKIIEAMAGTGLDEVILGSFGSKIAVDSHLAEKWTSLGKSFDSTWGFSDCYDFESVDEFPIWQHTNEFLEGATKEKPEFTDVNYYTPPAIPKCKFSKGDLALFKKASSGFVPNAFGGTSLKRVLREAESEKGRVPLGLLMMTGYGICNAILEIDTSVETFDYEKYDIVGRLKFLIKWCKKNLPKRQSVMKDEDNTSRVLVNLRDFTNYHRSPGGLENGLRLVDALSSLPRKERPFGFIMEEPTGWLFPDEVGRLCRMIRLTMERAGFPQGRFLVHIHWYFGLAEAVQLAALCNGADGVWAAVCKAGAQVGHACSTMTAVNLYRAGKQQLVEKYNLANMCKAAREVTAISTREPCPTHEEVYGELAFDIPFFMTNLPACRYTLAMLIKELDVTQRTIRLNEISSTSAVHFAMVGYFGPPEEAGWDPCYIKKMWVAIHDHLLTGLSRDYNSPLGLGHLYALVSRKQLPQKMVSVMMGESKVSDYHPTVLEFIQRWNRLCAKYEGDQLLPHPATRSKSIMMWGTDFTVEPRLLTLPFEYFSADVLRNPVLEPIPRLFKLQVVSLLTQDEKKLQGLDVPMVHFHEMVLRLKLFVSEADSLGVLAQVDDFCIRKNHDYFFGEDHFWLAEVRGSRPKVVNKLLRKHIDFYPKFYATKGNNAMLRCVKAAAKRIEENKGIRADISDTFRRGSSVEAVQTIMTTHGVPEALNKSAEPLRSTHKDILYELAQDEGQDSELMHTYLLENEKALGHSVEDYNEEELADAIVQESIRIASGASTRRASSGLERPSNAQMMIRQGSKLFRIEKDTDPLKAVTEAILLDRETEKWENDDMSHDDDMSFDDDMILEGIEEEQPAKIERKEAAGTEQPTRKRIEKCEAKKGGSFVKPNKNEFNDILSEQEEEDPSWRT